MSRMLPVMAVWCLLVVPALAQKPGKSPSQESAVKVFSLQNAKAAELEKVVSKLFTGQGTASRIRFSADHRTNSLITIGPRTDLEVIEALVMKLDSGSDNSGDGNSVQAGPSKLVATLRQRILHLESEISRIRSRFPPPRRSPNPPGLALESSRTARKSVAKGTEVRVQARPLKGGSLKVVSIVPAGKRVKKGDVLIQFDSADLEEAISQQRMATHKAHAEVRQREAALKSSLIERDLQMTRAKLAIDVAKGELNAFTEGTRALELRILQRELEIAKSQFANKKKLADAAKISATALQLARADLEVAETKLKVFQKYTSPATTTKLTAELALAEQESIHVRHLTEKELKSAEAQVQSSKVLAEHMAVQQDRLMQNFKRRQILAPHDGVVSTTGLSSLRPGSQVRSRQVLMILVPKK